MSMGLPHLDYCAVVWAECCKDDATKLERIQKTGMWLILNEGWNCPSSVMISRLGWTSLASRRRMMRAAYIRRCMQRLGPGYMRNMLKTNEDMGVCSARHLKDIYLPSHRTSWLEKSFILCAGKDWNCIPVAIREASHHTFKTSLRHYFTD